MRTLPYSLDQDDPATAPMGLIILEVDETIETEFRHLIPSDLGPLFVSRLRSSDTVNCSNLRAMRADLISAADLLPKARSYPVVGFACTSASSVIGSDKVEELVRRGCHATAVTDPLRAAVERLKTLGISNIALLSPYIEEVNEPLRSAFAVNSVSTDVFGTFGEAREAKVARISISSIVEAASELGRASEVEGVFISCTNLRTYAAIPDIEARIGKPVISSNLALAWHMKMLKQKK